MSRTAHNPYGGLTGMVDRMIGDAYPVLKALYDEMPLLKAVALAITSTGVGAPMLTKRAVVASGATGLAGSTVIIDFPDLDMTLDKILDSTVKIVGNDGALYFADSGYFTTKITAAGLSLTLNSGAPLAVSEAIVQWFVIYGD